MAHDGTIRIDSVATRSQKSVKREIFIRSRRLAAAHDERQRRAAR